MNVNKSREEDKIEQLKLKLGKNKDNLSKFYKQDLSEPNYKLPPSILRNELFQLKFQKDINSVIRCNFSPKKSKIKGSALRNRRNTTDESVESSMMTMWSHKQNSPTSQKERYHTPTSSNSRGNSRSGMKLYDLKLPSIIIEAQGYDESSPMPVIEKHFNSVDQSSARKNRELKLFSGKVNIFGQEADLSANGFSANGSTDFQEMVGGQKKDLKERIVKREVIISSPPMISKKADSIKKQRTPINLNMDMLSDHISRNYSVNDDLGEFMNEEQQHHLSLIKKEVSKKPKFTELQVQREHDDFWLQTQQNVKQPKILSQKSKNYESPISKIRNQQRDTPMSQYLCNLQEN